MTITKFTGTHMLVCIVGFFTVIVAVNMTLAIYATSTWTGLVAKNGYVTSQAYNGVLENARQQEARGWISELVLVDGGLEFNISGRDGKALTDLKIEATISRAIHEFDDIKVAFASGTNGNYSAEAVLKDGQWDVDLRAVNASGETYRRVFRLWVEPET